MHFDSQSNVRSASVHALRDDGLVSFGDQFKSHDTVATGARPFQLVTHVSFQVLSPADHRFSALVA